MIDSRMTAIKLFCVAISIALAAANPLEQSPSTYDRLSAYYEQSGRSLEDSLAEDAGLSTLGLVAKYGYTGEEHIVQTEDGYLLTIHRILPQGNCAGDKRPVLVQHGLLSSSTDWVVMGPGQGLGYLLADACYDVWMGNSRGNTYSRNHVSLSNKSDEYWNFSWHEMGLYDLPSVIDYILHKTEQQKLYYIGHSQGTTQYFIMDSLKPEYSNKVRAMFAMAPIAYMGNAESTFIKKIAKFAGVIGWVADTLGINQLLPSSDLISEIGGNMCNDDHPNSQNVCSNLIFAMCGYDAEETNKTMLPVILAHTPAGSATKQFLHYAQLMDAGVFQMYDYGKKENNERYGQKTPPHYPLSQAKSNYAIFYSENDYFANVKDVDSLYLELNNPIGIYKVSWKQFNHLDYMWAIHAKPLVYDYVMNIMDRY